MKFDNPFAFHSVLNSAPGVEFIRYLELGYGDGKNFEALKIKSKVSVDIDAEGATHRLLTDEFFKNHCHQRFDVIFIDAGHSAEQVLTDWNSSLDFITNNGLIFVHDLVPPNEISALPTLCGDGYRFLETSQRLGFTSLTLLNDYGLTMFTEGRKMELSELAPPGIARFYQRVKTRSFVSFDEFKDELHRGVAKLAFKTRRLGSKVADDLRV